MRFKNRKFEQHIQIVKINLFSGPVKIFRIFV